MRLLIATGLYPPDIGGPATYTKMLEEHLPQHGYTLLVAPYGWVRRYPRIVRHAVYAWKLVRESASCDVIYALDPVSVGVPALIAHTITKKPLMLRIAGDYAWEQGQQRFGVTDTLDEFVKRKKRLHPFVALLVWLERRVAENAERIIVPSQYMKGIIEAWGIDGKKITPIYSALHPLEVKETRDEIRTLFQYKGIVLATAGRLVLWKGMRRLIEVLPEVIERVGDTTLVIIGSGPLEAMLKKTAREIGMSNNVRFVGALPKDTLGTAIKGADVFVLNTSYEGMSHQLLEVMDLGVPIVTTRVGGNPELIEDGISGLLVPFDNAEELVKAIERVATHTHMREGLIQHARLRVKDFEKERCIQGLVDVLKRDVMGRV